MGPGDGDCTVYGDCNDGFGNVATLTVASGVTLTVGAGSLVKAKAGLVVNGSLVVSGTAQAPVVFTSWLDDGVGGDTNGDGSGSAPQPGDWPGIVVEPAGGDGAGPVMVRADYARVSFGRQGVKALQATDVVLSNSTFTDSARDGVDIFAAASAPTVTNNTFLRNGNGGPCCSVDDVALWVESDFLNLDLIHGNNGSGNGYDGAWISGTVATDSTLSTVGGFPMGPGDGDCTVYGDCNDGSGTLPP